MLLNIDQLIYTFICLSYLFTLFFQFKLLCKCGRAPRTDRLSSNCLMNMFAWCLGSVSGLVLLSYMAYCNGGAANGLFLLKTGLYLLSVVVNVLMYKYMMP